MGTIWVKNHVRHLLRNNTLNENDNVNEGNQSCLVTIFCMEPILTKMTILEMGN